MKARALACIALAPLALAAAAGDIVIGPNDADGRRDCKGASAAVNGNDARLTLEGCRSVTVNGNDNTVDAGAPESLNVFGNGNHVTWTPGADGRRAKILNLGNENKITEAAPAPASSGAPASKPAEAGKANARSHQGVGASAPSGSANVGLPALGGVAITASGEHRTYDCKGAAAFLAGDDNDLVLKNCTDVNVSGDRNQIRAEGPKSLTVSGDHNRIRWTGAGRPGISDTGDDNTFEQAR